MNWFLKVLGVVVMVGLVPLLQAEAYGWCFWLAERVVRRAARVLPGQVRGRYQAEWLADLDTLEGRNLFALLWAIKTLMYAPGVRQAVGGRPLRHLAAKRGLDVLVAGLVLLLPAPLLLAIALAVKLTSRGPVVLRRSVTLPGRRPATLTCDRRMLGGGSAGESRAARTVAARKTAIFSGIPNLDRKAMTTDMAAPNVASS